ncbi:MAG: TIGR03790 family protein [Opitutaceae bacterium]
MTPPLYELRQKWQVWWILWAFVVAGFAARTFAAENAAERVIILANSADPDSLRIARHYAKARGVPEENIFAPKMSVAETISWRVFVAEIWQPVRDELVRRDLIDAFLMEGTDEVGRKKYAVNGHRITALVICRGVPMGISHDPSLYTENLPLTRQQSFRSNAGVVDSELSLLGAANYNINAFVPNPLFQNDAANDPRRAQIIAVGRLDGPSAEDAISLVDRALTVERVGLIGRAYVDIGGIYPEADRWFESVAAQLHTLGFDTAVDRLPTTIFASARSDEPALYFGWYASHLNGPFALPGYRFAPGAVALHIHSFSATSLRSSTSGWTAPLVARGVTATVGNVHEPYLNLTHRPDLLLRALSRGESFGEAGLFSLPALSWQTVLVGDPLYRPFAVSFAEQWKNRATLPPAAASYVVLRQVNLLEQAGNPAEALALLRETQSRAETLPVGIALAQRLQKAGDVAGAARALEFGAKLKNFRTDEWGLARDAAQLLAANGAARPALEVYRALLGIDAVPRELRVAWLSEAANVALAAEDRAQSAAWAKALEALNQGSTKK